jgi:hypothetical protein
MKNLLFTRLIAFVILILALPSLLACNEDNVNEDNTVSDNSIVSQTLTDSDKEALLFMLEEEKLARDTYIYLNDLWSVNQFANIKNSEQTHMDAVENLLIQNNIAYSILPVGEFADQNLQNFYNQFVADGAISLSIALQIGATIEDLDIVDLEDYMDLTTNTDLISVFEGLQCGSRNHLRSFISAIENNGDIYSPQFLSEDAYNAILNASHERCN